MNRFVIIVLFICLFCLTGLRAQIWNYREYNLENGLASSYILSLFQDSRGNLWIGTNGEGVSKFNGKEFSNINQGNGLSDNYVFSIAEDKKGNILFGTNNGLCVYNGKKFRKFTTENGLPHNRVFKILIDSRGIIWIGTEKGLGQFVNDSVIRFNECKHLEGKKVYTIYNDSFDNLWFGTWGSGLVKYDRKNYKVFNAKDSLYNEVVTCIYQTKDGVVWIGTQGGLNFCPDNSAVLKKTPDISIIGSLLENSIGEFLICKYTGFVTKFNYRIENKNLVSFDKSYAIFENYGKIVRTTLKDREGNLWIGTANGLFKFSDKIFYNYFYSDKDSVKSDIKYIFQTKKGDYWFGTRAKSLMHVVIDTFNLSQKNEQFQYNLETPISQISSIAEDGMGNIWFGAINGVTRFDGKLFTNFTTKIGLEDKARYFEREKKKNAITTSLNDKKKTFANPAGNLNQKKYKVKLVQKDAIPNKVVHCLYYDRNGVMWIGTEKGVAVARDTSFENFGLKYPPLKYRTIWNIRQDKNQDLWFGTDSGAYCLSKNKLTHFGGKSGFTNSGVISTGNDRDGNIWFGTKEGLFRYNFKTFESINQKSGLNSDNILSLIFDDEGNLYAGGNQGIDKLDVNTYNKSGKILIDHYGKNENFQGLECMINAAFKDNRGRIWIGTKEGATVIDRKYIVPNKVKPVTYINKIQLDYKDLDSATILKYSGGLDPVSFLPVDMLLPYDKNRLTFHFVATSLSIPEKVKYQYMLEGLTDEWSPPSGKNEADYQGLNNGTYTFKVRACNDDGVWNEIPVTFTFTISPPFWKTWWFYTILAVVVVVGVVIYIREREKKLIKEKEILEQKVKERTAELHQANEEITAQRDDIQEKNDILHEQKEILQQQKEEITLQAAELEKLSIVASETDNAVMIMDGTGHFEWINEGFTKMYGYTLEELKRELGHNIIENTGNAHLKELIDFGFDSHEPIIYEAQTHTKWGEKLWAQTTISPIFNDAGEVVKLVAIDSNIHKMKLAEEEIKQQKEEIEAQRDEIVEQKKIVEEKNKDITDSINYAKNIQNAILPSLKDIQGCFSDTFVLFKPRDIVSGDFYWFNDTEQYSYIAAVDCTGHGVPGAFMSMLGFAFLNEIVNKEAMIEPNIILNKLREQIIKSLHQEGKFSDSKDGMDIVLLVFDKQTKMLQFAGANNPLYLIRNHELIEYKGEKMPIAYHIRMEPFSKMDIQLFEGDTLYFFSDGLADQFGGPKGKKFMYKHLKELLVELNDHPMEEIHKLLDYAVEEWKHYIDPETGNPFSQVDDVLMIGVRI